MNNSFSVAFRQTLNHLVSQGLHLLWIKWLIIAVHVGFEVLVEEIENQPKSAFAVDEVLQGTHVGVIDFLQQRDFSDGG